jgi:hypothetical protein
MVVATVAIGIWAVFLGVMLRATDTDDVQWARMTFVFASVEAVAFAAAGAIFGVTVQRERVKSAEEKAETNARDAANGRALAIAAISDGHPAAAPEAYSFDSEQAPDVRQRHADLARRLFPDLT